MLVSVWANPPSRAAIGLIVIKCWFGPRITLYDDMSRRVVRSILEFVPDVEIYSIDEVFSTFDHCSTWTLSRCAEPFESVAMDWHSHFDWYRPTKTLAKLANRIAKKDPTTQVCSNFPKPIPIASGAFVDVGMFGVLVLAGAPSFEALASVPPWTWPACPPMTCGKDSMSWPNERRWNFGDWCQNSNVALPSTKNIGAFPIFFGDMVTDFEQMSEAIANHAVGPPKSYATKRNRRTGSVFVHQPISRRFAPVPRRRHVLFSRHRVHAHHFVKPCG